MITGTFCSRILGLVRDAAFFAAFGSSLQASAFLIAFAIPNLFRRLCGEGALSSAFIPVFAQRVVREKASTSFFLNVFFSRMNIILGLGVGVSMLGLLLLQTQLQSDDKWGMVTRLTCLMLPYLWFICLAALYNGALNVFNAFSLSAFSPVLLNLCMITGLVVSMFYKTHPINIVALSVVIGGFLQWYLPRCQLVRLKVWRPQFCWKDDEDLQRIWWLFLPSVFGAAIFQINTLLGRFMAYCIDEEAVSLLYLANRFLELPLGLFAFAIISYLLPKISLYEAQHNINAAKDTLAHSLNLLLSFLLPASIGLFILAEPILQLFFCWGKFTVKNVQAAAPLLQIFAIGLPFFGLTSLFSRVFYAQKDTQTPVRTAFYALLMYIVVALLLMPTQQAAGLAWASTLSAFFQCVLLSHLLKKKHPHYHIKLLPLALHKAPCMLLLGLFTYILLSLLPEDSNKMELGFLLIAIISLNALMYIFILFFTDKTAFNLLKVILGQRTHSVR